MLQLVRHTPRREKQGCPSVHVEELQGKVSVRGSITGVSRPAGRPTCSFLNFSCHVRSFSMLVCVLLQAYRVAFMLHKKACPSCGTRGMSFFPMQWAHAKQIY